MPDSVAQCPHGMNFLFRKPSFAHPKNNSMLRIPTPLKSFLTLGIGLVMALAVAAQDRAYILCEGALDFQSGVVTESPRLGVVDLGVEDEIVGVTKFCLHTDHMS